MLGNDGVSSQQLTPKAPTLRWRGSSGFGPSRGSVVIGSLLYQLALTGVYLTDAADGRVLWSYPLAQSTIGSADFNPSPLAAQCGDRQILVACNRYKIVVWDVTNVNGVTVLPRVLWIFAPPAVPQPEPYPQPIDPYINPVTVISSAEYNSTLVVFNWIPFFSIFSQWRLEARRCDTGETLYQTLLPNTTSGASAFISVATAPSTSSSTSSRQVLVFEIKGSASDRECNKSLLAVHDADTGAVISHHPLLYGAQFCPMNVVIGDGDVAVVLFADGVLRALRISTGLELWTFAGRNVINIQGNSAYNQQAVTMSADRSMVFVNWITSHLYALNATTGTLVWEFYDPVLVSYSLIRLSVLYTPGDLLLVLQSGYMRAFNARDGSVKWTVPVGGEVFHSIALDSRGGLYLTSQYSDLVSAYEPGILFALQILFLLLNSHSSSFNFY